MQTTKEKLTKKVNQKTKSKCLKVNQKWLVTLLYMDFNKNDNQKVFEFIERYLDFIRQSKFAPNFTKGIVLIALFL